MLANKLEEPKVRDRRFAIDEYSARGILESIQIRAEKCKIITRTDLPHYCGAEYSRSVSRGWVKSFIFRHRDDLTETTDTHHEDPRLKMPSAFGDETICCLREYIQGTKAQLVLNLDEISLSEWENRKDKKVIAPTTMDGQTTCHHALRNVKHISIITCISIGGELLALYIVISQDFEPLRRRLMSRGVHLGVHLVLRE
jgi:hypothetical protein